MISIQLNVSNQMRLIYSNVSKFFKKQQSNMLYCFTNSRRSLEESSDSMHEKLFLKKIEVRSFWEVATKRDNQNNESI